MHQLPFTLPAKPYPLAGVHHLPSQSPAPYVISVHGMLSTKDSPKYLSLGTLLGDAGFGFIRFDFTGCGESGGTLGEATLTRRIEDLTQIIDWVRSLETCDGRVGLFGSSMGGTVALTTASLRPIDVLVLLATPVRQTDPPPAELREIRERYPHFFEDFRANVDTFPFEKIHHTLVIHGTRDCVVPFDNAWFIYERISPPKEIWLVQEADHQFLDETHRQAMLEMSVRWFERFLPRS
jgi:dipeptidyl aminopeptidase/acylaminoacyl peptidase